MRPHAFFVVVTLCVITITLKTFSVAEDVAVNETDAVPNRQAQCVVPRFEVPGIVCPWSDYMGLTNMILNMLECLLLASVAGCGDGQFVAYIPYTVQHGTILDLFHSSALTSLEHTLHIRISLFCRGEIAMIPQWNVTHRQNVTLLRGKACGKKTLRIQSAFELDLFPPHDIVPHFHTLLKMPSELVRNAVKKIQSGLGRPYIGIHLRLEPDVWALMDYWSMSTTSVHPHLFFNTTFVNFVNKHLNATQKSWSMYGTYRTSGGVGLLLRDKSDFIDEGSMNATTSYTIDNRVVTISNSTAALVDFIVVWESNVALVARYSSFGTYLRDLRCVRRGRFVGPTFEYGKDLSVRDPCED